MALWAPKGPRKHRPLRPISEFAANTVQLSDLHRSLRGKTMLHYALVFLVVAIIAGIFGFTGIAGTSAWIAHVLFVLFLVLFIISLIFRGRPSV
jgi:uncharacterized membrane protein YtjA (UPF0391 family)